jgi:cell division protein FtsA
MLKNKVNIVTILDICSTKIVCLIAKLMHNKKYDVIGIGYTRSEGIKSGIISDISLAQKSIMSAVSDAEKMAGVKAIRAYIPISSNSLLSNQIVTQISVAGRDITNKDLNKLLLDAIQICKNQQLEIIHTFACDYILDGNHGILNPIGMYGNKLACRFHILSAPSNNLLNLHNCIVKAGLEIENYVSASYAAGLACLTKDEIETGVTLIDLGAGVTSVAIFENDQMVYADAIPIGGNHITSDIAKMLCITISEAERIKNLYGGVISTELDLNEIIDINKKNDDDNHDINRAQLIAIIQARIEEIIQIIEEKLKNYSIASHNKIVITGGVARTLRLKEFLAYRLKTKVSLGYPKTISIINNQNNSLELATSLGVLSHINDNIMTTTTNGFEQKSNNHLKNLIAWFKKTFF